MAAPAHAPPEIEDALRWPVQGEWTWEDYQRLPEDGQRYEIIDGVLYVAPAPSYAHQFSVYGLARLLGNHVAERQLGVVLGAPFDIRLPGVAHPVQPDLLFFKTGNEPRSDARHFVGVPDLVVEVISPRTRRIDQQVKFGAYERAGVPEYWLVDPEDRSIKVHIFQPRSRSYEDLGRFGAGDRVRSRVLVGFTTPVTPLFP